jgi:hypothetical protein
MILGSFTCEIRRHAKVFCFQVYVILQNENELTFYLWQLQMQI